MATNGIYLFSWVDYTVMSCESVVTSHPPTSSLRLLTSENGQGSLVVVVKILSERGMGSKVLSLNVTISRGIRQHTAILPPLPSGTLASHLPKSLLLEQQTQLCPHIRIVPRIVTSRHVK